MQSLLPTDLPSSLRRSSDDLNVVVRDTNRLLRRLCEDTRVTDIDLHRLMVRNNRLSPDFSLDGIHINPAGYEVWISKEFLVAETARLRE